MHDSPKFAVGDRVRIITDSPASAMDKLGTVAAISSDGYGVEIPGYVPMWYGADELAPAGDADELAALAIEFGAVEYTSYADAGLLCRRFRTPDGSIDLTVRVK